jgi:hypothetical protein
MEELEILRQQAQAKVIMVAREILTGDFTVQAAAVVLVQLGLLVLAQPAAMVAQGLHHQSQGRL